MKTLSRFLLALAFAASPAFAQFWSGPQTGLSMSNTTATGAQTAINTAGSTSVLFHAGSGAGSTSSVTFEQSIDGTHYYTSATITNGAAAGELWACPAARFARFNVVSHSAGTLYGYMATRSMSADPIGQSCKKVDFNATASLGAITATSLTASGTVTAQTLASTAGITAATTVAATGGVSGTTGAFSAGVSGTTGTFSGAIAGTTLTASAGVAGTTGTFSAGVAGTTGTFSGAVAGSSTGAFTTSVATNRFLSTGTTPGIDAGASTCGTAAPSIAGKDQAGVITVGSVSGTVCNVTFNVPFSNAPSCTANGTAATNLKTSATTTVLTITGTLTAAEKISFLCFGF